MIYGWLEVGFVREEVGMGLQGELWELKVVREVCKARFVKAMWKKYTRIAV